MTADPERDEGCQTRVQIVVADACRSIPKLQASSRGLTRAWRPPSVLPRAPCFLLGRNRAGGRGRHGENGTYTTSARGATHPEPPSCEMFKIVQRGWRQKRTSQVPAVYDECSAEFYFRVDERTVADLVEPHDCDRQLMRRAVQRERPTQYPGSVLGSRAPGQLQRGRLVGWRYTGFAGGVRGVALTSSSCSQSGRGARLRLPEKPVARCFSSSTSCRQSAQRCTGALSTGSRTIPVADGRLASRRNWCVAARRPLPATAAGVPSPCRHPPSNAGIRLRSLRRNAGGSGGG